MLHKAPLAATVGTAQLHDRAVGSSEGHAAAEAEACIGEIKESTAAKGISAI